MQRNGSEINSLKLNGRPGGQKVASLSAPLLCGMLDALMIHSFLVFFLDASFAQNQVCVCRADSLLVHGDAQEAAANLSKEVVAV